MRTIELDGTGWTSVMDFYEALLVALGAPGAMPFIDRHGRNVNAFIDSMVYGGMHFVEPPYAIRALNARLPEVREAVQELSDALRDAQNWRPELGDASVSIKLD